jgi:hypothetical protein
MVILNHQGELETREGCTAFGKQVFGDLDSNRYRYVVLGGYWSAPEIKTKRIFYINEKHPEPTMENNRLVLEEAFSKTVDTIVKHGAIPVIIRDNPTILKSEYRCSIRKILGIHNVSCDSDRKLINEHQQYIQSLFDRLAKKYPQLMFIDTKKILCDNKKCITEMNGIPLYRDDDHFNAVGSATIGKLYYEKYGNPFRAAEADTQ